MTDEIPSRRTHPATATTNAAISASRGVLYFLGRPRRSGGVRVLRRRRNLSYLDKRSEAEQTPVNPLVTNAPADTATSSTDYPQDRIPQSQTGNRRARPTQRHPPQRRTNTQHLRLHRQKRRHRPHPHRPRHGPDRPARLPHARTARPPARRSPEATASQSKAKQKKKAKK